jgi:6-phosphogluconate dehydrogenase
MKLGFIGLGRMGGHMVARLVQADHEIIITGRNPEHVAAAAKETGATLAGSYADMVAQLGADPIVWLMVPADAVDDQLAELMPHLPKGAVIVDGGNSDFRNTLRRAKLAEDHGLHLVDCGTSGGILGATAGYCLMVGGDPAVAKRLEPVFTALAQPGGWGHLGPTGAGHYIKMIHNAIEYGLMESYAEGYRLLHDGQSFHGLDLASIAEVWQHGSIVASGLNGLAVNIFRANPDLAGIDGYVAETGEARWTLEQAAAEHIELPAIQTAMDVRKASQAGRVHFGTKLLAALRQAFGGHAIGKPK